MKYQQRLSKILSPPFPYYTKKKEMFVRVVLWQSPPVVIHKVLVRANPELALLRQVRVKNVAAAELPATDVPRWVILQTITQLTTPPRQYSNIISYYTRAQMAGRSCLPYCWEPEGSHGVVVCCWGAQCVCWGSYGIYLWGDWGRPSPWCLVWTRNTCLNCRYCS